ncbi:MULTISPECIES: hypothetical protein [unclassified Cytobacillus]|uniref:hypothetical protein n=1 Tax=unclassified Cytobacillus TaxID=2675268 RepID=UPI0013575D10|nr:hypothetical protein [Cytobacillus sp. AMY 15.2]KAF0816535.1 hypothetical protein KIS4809_4602 [Bacillus sp. ZZV12-4809]MCM3090249.1 hypothetical protein [Cytobacillus sp. AMY 15.2]
MKSSFGSDNSFRELGHIPRSQKQKQESLQKILSSIEEKPKRKKDIFPGILSAAAVMAACVMFAFIIFSEDSMSRGSSSSEILGNSIISQTMIALSDDEKSFSADGKYTAETAIVKDPKWENTARNTINSAIPAETVIEDASPSYDIQFNLKGKEPVKIKVWNGQGKTYFKLMNSEDIYSVPSSEGDIFIEYLEAITQSLHNPH